MAVVTAGLALAAAMLALVSTAQASSTAVPAYGNSYLPDSAIAVSSASAAPTGTPALEPSSSVTSTVTPTPLPTTTPTPKPTPSPVIASKFMPMPVQGVWRVICGYRCGLHDKEHSSTFAIDIVRDEGKTAGQPVLSPVDGRITAVKDSSTYFCRGKKIDGIKAGAVIVIDFAAPSGTALRLRLVHIDPAAIPDELRPNGKPVTVNAGTVLGSVLKMDRCSHLHISLTHLEERREVPVPLTIEGILLEDCDDDNCWRDKLIPLDDR